MKIYVLNDNIPLNATYAAEHGLSLLIQTHNKLILFDVGQNDAFVHNAKALGLDLSLVDMLIISHGHVDHGGGIHHFLAINQKAPIYIHKKAFNDFYSIRQDNDMAYIGLDKTLKDHPRVVLTHNYYEIEKGIQLFTPIENNSGASSTNQTLLEKINDTYIPDTFDHEQNLLLEENGISLLITGCGHRGIQNITEHATRMHQAPLDYIIGGFHLYSFSHQLSKSSQSIHQLAQFLKQTRANIYTCHCTGLHPFHLLQETLGDHIQYCYGGLTIKI